MNYKIGHWREDTVIDSYSFERNVSIPLLHRLQIHGLSQNFYLSACPDSKSKFFTFHNRILTKKFCREHLWRYELAVPAGGTHTQQDKSFLKSESTPLGNPV